MARGKRRAAKTTNEDRAGDASPRKPLERLLFEAAEQMEGERILLTSTAAAQAAAEVAKKNPSAEVICNYLDLFLAESAREQQKEAENLKITCEPDLPSGKADCVALALPARGENELAREFLQQARQRLNGAGRLFASTDNPKDRWLREQLQNGFEKISERPAKDGHLYIASRPKPLKKEKDYSHWFAFRDEGRLFDVMSRPGVFSHRKLDLGARALMDSLAVPDGAGEYQVVQDGMKVLDLGCGSGAVGLAASARAENVAIHFLDANARAAQCSRTNAEKNGLQNFAVQLECQGECKGSGTFDLVLANPPYFSNFRIAEVFLKATKRALKPGGRTHFVTKQAQWFAEQFAETFEDVSIREVRGYFVVKGTQPERRKKRR